ncbi:uncharacterized protein BXZ73DRAFT_76513 [Epithele typhae]|uniref:uncharacterized protein n=1 Tax=Epithele typhae TaxID=378194 RepID=UPI0020087BB2|nr:uncharacterized protein BXZ73DRAFT_76513 [Epithele typhae]KAH9937885.1 hypothetical protein BXZ73DRAFT_76513 [Epithele typhae]
MPQEALKEDEDLRYSDGNIMIIANNCAFRLYKGILASESLVFENMFSVPQPEDAEYIDGCPVVSLADRASDLRVFFMWLFKSHLPRFHHVWSGSSYEVASLLRIGHKYEALSAIEPAVFRLKSRLRSPFWDWDYQEDAWTGLEWDLDCDSVILHLDHIFDIVNLMRLVNEFATSPNAPRFSRSEAAVALFYSCVVVDASPSLLWDGQARSDGTVDHLSSRARECCMRALEFIHDETHRSVAEAFSNFESRFTNRPDRNLKVQKCLHELDPDEPCLSKIRERAVKDRLNIDGKPKVQEAWVRMDKWTVPPSAYVECLGNLCSRCMEELLSCHYGALESAWHRIESFLLDASGWVPNDP